MATYYWVGGSGTWDATTTTNWASTSGGAGGAGVPTSADDVIFDANSNTGTNPFTVTIAGTTSAPAVCNDFSTGGAGGALDGVMTISMSATAFLDVYGSIDLPATNLTWSGLLGSGLRFKSTISGKTITTNGVTITGTRFIFDGAGGEWTLGSALTTTANTSSAINLLQGTFSTGNYNVTISGITVGGSLTSGLYLGSSTVTLSNTTAVIVVFGSTNLTFDAGTSTIICSPVSPTFTGGGLTYYNVSFTNTGSGTTTINGANTFNNLTQTSRSATGTRIVRFGDNQIINGTLTLGAANTAIRRMVVQSDAVGTQRTITLNGTLAALADVDFRDISAAGTVATPWTGTRLGDCLGNANITFDAPKTVYRVGTGNWSATQWSLSSGGAVNVNNFPLAQDTMIFDANTTTGTHAIDQAWNLGNLDCSAVTSAVTIAGGSLPTFYGDITLDADITLTGTTIWTLAGQGTTQTITSAGVTFTQPLTINLFSGTVLLADNLTTNLDITLSRGTLDLDDNTLTCRRFNSNNSNTRSIAFGTSGKIDVTGNDATVFDMGTMTNFSYTGTPDFEFNYSGSTGTRTIIQGNTAGATETNVVNLNIVAGSDNIGMTSGSAKYKNLIFSNFTGSFGLGNTCFGNIVLSASSTSNAADANLNFSATTGTQQITTNGVAIDRSIAVNTPGATVELQDNLTIGSTRTFTLTEGTLDLNDNTLSTGLFSSNNSNTRSIAFGTGQIDVTGNGAIVLIMNDVTNFSYTGTPDFNFTYSGSTGTRTINFGNGGGVTETNAININVTAGSDSIAIASNTSVLSGYRNLNYTGFTGSGGTGFICYGNLTLGSGMTVPSSTSQIRFAATSGTQEITTNGVTIDRPTVVNAPGATVQLQDALTIAAGRTLTHTAGTIDLNNQTLTTDSYSVSGTTTRVLATGTTGTLALRNSGIAFSNTTTSGWSATGTGKVSLTSASSKTFEGNNQTYSFALDQGGAGDLVITGANTFGDITNSYQPAKIIFPANTTTNVQAFTLRGLPGNNITIESSVAGQQFTLNYAP